MPAKKPIEDHILNSTYRRDRHAKPRLRLQPGSVGDPPVWLSAQAKREWRRLATHPVIGTLLTDGDRDILAEYLLLRDKLIASANGGDVKLTSTERQALNSLRQQLGLSPGSRQRLDAPPPPPPESPWAELRRQSQELASARRPPTGKTQ